MNELIMQKYKMWTEIGPICSSVSMLVNGNDYLCTIVPADKSDDFCRNAFWRMIWSKKTMGIVAMTTRAHYINYFPKIIGKCKKDTILFFFFGLLERIFFDPLLSTLKKITVHS